MEKTKMDEPVIKELEPQAQTIQNEPMKKRIPWLTGTVMAICIVIFLGINFESRQPSWETLSHWGALPPTEVWDGSIWALITSVFVHIAIYHLVFNLYWLWKFGRLLEEAIGRWRWIVFFLSAAFVSSAVELAVSDSTGIGASGVVYAMFGFMWMTRDRFPEFRALLDKNTIIIFILWLIGCMIVTLLNIWNVGNAAHVSGLAFGILAGIYFIKPFYGKTTLAILILYGLLSAIPLFWAPWSLNWQSVQAYNAHHRHEYKKALDHYNRIIARDSQNAWAFYGRCEAYRALGEFEKAQSDLDQAHRLAPNIGKEK
jgi:GlpG protein